MADWRPGRIAWPRLMQCSILGVELYSTFLPRELHTMQKKKWENRLKKALRFLRFWKSLEISFLQLNWPKRNKLQISFLYETNSKYHIFLWTKNSCFVIVFQETFVPVELYVFHMLIITIKRLHDDDIRSLFRFILV